MVASDPTAARRGVKRVLLHFTDWQQLGEPTTIELHCIAGWYVVPVFPSGRRRGVVRWYYRRAMDGPPPGAR